MSKKTEEAETRRVSSSFSPKQVCLLYRLIMKLQSNEDPRDVLDDPAYQSVFQIVGHMLQKSGAAPLDLPEEEQPSGSEQFTREECEALEWILKALLIGGDPTGIRFRKFFPTLVKKVAAMRAENEPRTATG